MAKKDEQQTEGVSAKSALIFEMDNVALGARRIRYEVLAGILKEQGIELTPILFSRYCLHPAPSIYMPKFLEAMGYAAAKPEQVVERLNGETTSRLMQKTTLVSEGLIKWMEAAVARGAAIACASMLPQASCDAVAEHLGFDRWNVQVYSGLPLDNKVFPRAEHWMRIAKAIGRTPKRCLALVSSMATTKTALAAMLNVVAVTDEFTEFQDFCGANLICSDLKEVDPNAFFKEISF
jgi:beta-phosphoglucomutase-like phosphatase (HAD superfamily)